MKLKLVVASMSVLGLVSCPVFADSMTTKHMKHKHHHVAKKHQMVSHTDYKSMGALPVVETCPPNQYASVLDVMDQNTGRAQPTEDCNKLITFAGGVNFDARWGNRGNATQGVNNQRIALNDAYLNIFGNVNDWSKAFASLSYGDPSGIASTTESTGGQYSNVYTNVTDNKVTLEQGFIRLANFDQSPFFVQIGKQFQDFGRYAIHPIHRSTTQVLSETLRTSAELGVVLPAGFHGDLYAFDNSLRERSASVVTASTSHPKTNYGAAIGFDVPSDQLGWGINVGYLYNMVGVNDVQQAVSQTTTGGFISGGSYHNRVGAVTVDAMVNSGPFSLIGDYVTATNRFSSTDLVGTGTNGAKPWAGNIKAGYGFNAWGIDQNAYLGYERTGSAVNVHLPRSRWVAGLGLDMWKNANVALELAHDIDYSTSNNGSGNKYNLIGLRAAVVFG